MECSNRRNAVRQLRLYFIYWHTLPYLYVFLSDKLPDTWTVEYYRNMRSKLRCNYIKKLITLLEIGKWLVTTVNKYSTPSAADGQFKKKLRHIQVTRKITGSISPPLDLHLKSLVCSGFVLRAKMLPVPKESQTKNWLFFLWIQNGNICSSGKILPVNEVLQF